MLFCYSQSATSWRVLHAISTNIFEQEWSSKERLCDFALLHNLVYSKCYYYYALTLFCGYCVLIGSHEFLVSVWLPAHCYGAKCLSTMNHNQNPLQSKQSAHSVVLTVSRCILATDMARHNEILNKFKVTLPVFDFRTEGHKEVVRRIWLWLLVLLFHFCNNHTSVGFIIHCLVVWRATVQWLAY